MSKQTGRFVVVEGPKGTGKTTATQLLAERLERVTQQHCIRMSQPSDTELGRLLRSSESSMNGRAYAMAIAADRLTQYEQIIGPALADGFHVVLDRYTPSSLVLQVIDGVSAEDVWQYNRYSPAPDMLFYLHNSETTLHTRLRELNRQTRIQSLGSPAQEIELYEKAQALLEREGWQQRRIDCRHQTTRDIVAHMIQVLRRTS